MDYQHLAPHDETGSTVSWICVNIELNSAIIDLWDWINSELNSFQQWVEFVSTVSWTLQLSSLWDWINSELNSAFAIGRLDQQLVELCNFILLSWHLINGELNSAICYNCDLDNLFSSAESKRRVGIIFTWNSRMLDWIVVYLWTKSGFTTVTFWNYFADLLLGNLG